jgi:hypothetical protein
VGVPLNENLPNATPNQRATGIDSEISFALHFESAVSWRPFAQRVGKGVFWQPLAARPAGTSISNLESTSAAWNPRMLSGSRPESVASERFQQPC